MAPMPKIGQLLSGNPDAPKLKELADSFGAWANTRDKFQWAWDSGGCVNNLRPATF